MKIAVLLSGGVDSSVALHLLQEAGGHEITAFYLKIWLEDELAFLGECPWEEDLAYCRTVCRQAGVPLEVVPLQKEYFNQVVAHAIRELEAGRTPSPDILCNRRIKFGAFFRAIDDSYDKVATGHYAQIEQSGGLYRLKRAPDPVKDQTYFLSNLTQAQLGRSLFPIGHLRKAEVRSLAERFDLPNQDRPDSQGICFLGRIQYNRFVQSYLGEQPGDIVEIESGHRLGQHSGYWFYTIGQRRGLGLSGGPWFVVDKDVAANIVYVSHKRRLREQARAEFTVSPVHWIAGEPEPTELLVKIRHTPQLEPGRIEPLGPDRWRVKLASVDPGIAPGQSAVFYEGEICLGSGLIE